MSDRHAYRTRGFRHHATWTCLALLVAAIAVLGTAAIAAADDADAVKTKEAVIRAAAEAKDVDAAELVRMVEKVKEAVKAAEAAKDRAVAADGNQTERTEPAASPVVQAEVAVGPPASGTFAEARFRVLKPDGTALSNTAVRARRTIQLPDDQGSHQYLARRTTDADGAFTIEQDMPGRWRVDIHVAGVGSAAVDLADVTVDKATDLQTVTLKGGADISGQIINGLTGKPLEGARVGLKCRQLDDGSRQFGPAAVRTDAEGKWALRAVPDGQWDIVAEKARYVYQRRTVTVAEGKPVADVAFRLDVDPELRCCVLKSDGTPLALATIRVRRLIRTPDGRRPKDERMTVTTDAEGWFSLRQELRGTWQVDVILDGTGWASAGPIGVTTKKPAEPQTMTLDEGLTVSGRVIDGDSGEAIPNVIVLVREQTFDGVQQFGPRTAATDAEGRWTLTTLPPGTWTLGAWKDRYHVLDGQISVVDGQFYLDGRQVAKAEFRLQRSPEFAARILQSDGTPLAEMRVRMILRHYESADGDSQYRLSRSLTTSADGEVRFALPKAGYWAAGVTVVDKGMTTSDRVEFKVGDTGTVVEMKLQPGYEISGTVVSKGTDTPVADARIQCSFKGGSLLASPSEVKSDAEGKWTIKGLYPGGWTVWADRVGYEQATTSVTVGESEKSEAVKLEMARKPSLAGTILDTDGNPAANIKLQAQLSRFRKHGRSFYCDYRDSASVTTDAEGNFELSIRGAGTWRLNVRAAGKGYARSEEIKVAAGEPAPPVTLKLVRGSRIAGTVVNKATGKPMSGVRVRSNSNDDSGEGTYLSISSVASDDEGKWEFKDVPEGSWSIYCSQSEFVQAQELVVVKPGKDKTDVRLAMIPYVTVTGVVLGPDLKTPIVKARVRHQSRSDSAVTDEKGRFSIELPPVPGQSITITSEDYAPVTHLLAFADEKAPPELWLILKTPASSISGTLSDGKTGKPISQATVLAIPVDANWDRWNRDWMLQRLHEMGENDHIGWGPFQQQIKAKADEFGVYQVKGLAAGKYYICVPRSNAANLVSKKITVAEGEAVVGIDLRSVETPPGYLYGRLLKPDGKPLAQTSVSTQFQSNYSGYGGSEQTDAKGQFRIRLRGVGQASVTLVVEGYEPISHRFQVTDKDAIIKMDFTLKPERPRGSVSGRVVASDGKTGVEGLYMTASAVREPEAGNGNLMFDDGGWRVAARSSTGGVKTDAEGKFHIKNLRPGKYVITASPRRNRHDRDEDVKKELANLVPAGSEKITVGEGEETKDVAITITKGGTVEGKVLEIKTNKAVPEARVSLSLRSASGNWAVSHWSSSGDLQGTTDEEGKFKIEGVPPGKYSLTVWADGYEYKRMSGWKSLTVKAEKTVKRTIRVTPDD